MTGSKMTRTVPMKGVSAAEVARHSVKFWILKYGPLAELIPENGGFFMSKFFINICKMMFFQNSFTATYYAQSNGQVEIYNSKILAFLRAYITDHPGDWGLYTNALTYEYNCEPHTSNKVAP